MSEYEQAIGELVSTMQEKLYELQTEKNSQLSKRNSLSTRLAELRKSKNEMNNYINYIQDQITLLTESSVALDEEKSKLALQLQNYGEKITALAEQARSEKSAWAKESDFLRSKLNHSET